MKSWAYSIDRALEKKLYRTIHLCRTNPDYRLKYPAETKLDTNRQNTMKINTEARKRVEHEHILMLKRNIVPNVIRPKRLNRSV